jgi:hypothetical protein
MQEFWRAASLIERQTYTTERVVSKVPNAVTEQEGAATEGRPYS